MKLNKLPNKKAQGFEDWLQAFIVAILLIFVFTYFLHQHATKTNKLEQETYLIKEKIRQDKILIEYLASPISECSFINQSDLFKNTGTSKITYADLINLFISGNPRKGKYSLDSPPKEYVFDPGSKGDEYFYFWAICTSEYGGFTAERDVIRISFVEKYYFDSSRNAILYNLPISSILIPTKSKIYPIVEASLMQVSSVREPLYEGTLPG